VQTLVIGSLAVGLVLDGNITRCLRLVLMVAWFMDIPLRMCGSGNPDSEMVYQTVH